MIEKVPATPERHPVNAAAKPKTAKPKTAATAIGSH